MKFRAIGWMIGLSGILLTSCYYDKGDKLYPNLAPCDSTAMNYNTHIKPIFINNCVNNGCHVSANPSGGILLETYNSTIQAIPGNKLINAVMHVSGGSKNMPPTGKLSNCEILMIEAWIRRGNPEN